VSNGGARGCERPRCTRRSAPRGGARWPAVPVQEVELDAGSSGARCATDVTGFGLLGHLYKLARASQVTAVIDASAVSYLEGARESIRAGYVSGGTRRNLAWVDPNVRWGGPTATDEDERLLLADAQTSGGLVICGLIPGAPVIGELRPRGDHVLEVR
jgi:selenide, water dikinase